MPIRRSPVDEANRRARSQLEALVCDLRNQRLKAGLSQAAVANALGASRPWVGAIEAGRIVPSPIELARLGAVVGLDITIRAFPGGSPLRDAGQLKLLARFRASIGGAWAWRTEVPVSADPRDRRAMDAVLLRHGRRVGIEAIARLVDAQGQVRPAQLKQEASGVERMVLVLSDTRQNRRALIEARPTLGPAFPMSARPLLAALRAGELPAANGVLMV